MHIFLYGTDSFRAKRKLDEIVAKFRAEHDSAGMNTMVVDGAKTSVGEIAGALGAAPFLGTRRLIVLRDFLTRKKGDQEQLAPAIEKLPTSSTVVFFENEDAVACKKSPLWKLLTSNKFNWEFSPLAGAELAGWIGNEAKLLGVTIDSPATQLLMQSTTDSARLSNELAKLSAYVGVRKQISKNDVAAMVPGDADEDMFGFLDAVANKIPAEAVKKLEQQIDAGTEPMQLLAMLARSIRLLIQAKDCIENGMPEAEAVKVLGVHPFAARKSLSQARRFTMENLIALHTSLLESDHAIKIGAAPTPRTVLDLFIGKMVV